MTDSTISTGSVLTVDLPSLDRSPELLSLLERRRSIRRLRPGPFPLEARDRLLEAIRLTPAAFNLPPWHVVLVEQTLDAFWALVERGFREQLTDERLARYLDRLEGFRPAVAVALVYEDTAIAPRLRDAWQISPTQADAFVQQGLGMLQLALWLALTADGLVTSLQHWDWLLEDRIAAFVGIDRSRYRLAAAMPIGHADEPPRAVERIARDRVVSLERVTLDLAGD